MSFPNRTASRRLDAMVVGVLLASAQAASAQADAAAPPLVYRSPFKTYGGFTEQKLMPWRAANDAAAQSGAGHGNAHGEAAPAATGTNAPAAAAGRGSHAGHGTAEREGVAAGDRAAPGPGGAAGHEGHAK